MIIPFQPNDRKIWAETLYIRRNFGLDLIAYTLSETKEIIEDWVKEGQWEKKRLSLVTSRTIQLECLFQLLDVATKKVLDHKTDLKVSDAELILKYTKAIKNLQTRQGLSEVLDAFDEYFVWLQREDCPLAIQVGATYDSFINYYSRQLEKEA